MRVTQGCGEYRPGERHVLFTPEPEQQDPDAPAVLYCHEHGADARTALQPILHEHFTALTDRGVVCLSADLGGPATWGCDDALSAVSDAWRFLIETEGVRSDRVCLYGGSMGTLADADRHSPLSFASELAGIPIVAWYSSNDPMAPPEGVPPFVAAVGPSASAVNLGRQGHAPVGVTGEDVVRCFVIGSRP